MNIENTLKNYSLDSFKIKIPIEKAQIVNFELNQHRMVMVANTSEIIKEYKENSLLIENNGVKTRFIIEVQPIDDIGNTREYLSMLINSKLIYNNYFQGISSNSINILYNNLMALKVANFSLNDLLNGELTDIDIKIDQVIELNPFNELINYFKNNSRESNQAGKGYKLFSQQNNKGIQFSVRQTTSFATNPYFKIYHKQIELDTKSNIFANAYLKGINYNDVVRTEFTIKNKKHIKSLGIKDNTLKTFLNLDNNFWLNVIQQYTSIHLGTNIKPTSKNKVKMTPTESIFYYFITTGMTSNQTAEKIIDNCISNIECRRAKSRKKKQLFDIYLKFIKGSKIDSNTKQVNSFLNNLGIE